MNAGDVFTHHVGERLSVKRQTCTVRYIGPVASKAGTWLGVEWDDPKRGKHDGTFDAVKYFTCRSKLPTAASFLKPTQPWEHPRSFLAALREKYMPEFHKDEAEIVYISGKQAEEIGFEKFSQRQARLQGIHVLVLDHMRISCSSGTLLADDEKKLMRDLCVDITELDLSGNLFESFEEILELCALLPRLSTLALDGNRFSTREDITRHQHIPTTTLKALSLSGTLLELEEVDQILPYFPNLERLALADNELTGPIHLQTPPSLSTLDLSSNNLEELSNLYPLGTKCPAIVILRRNRIHSVTSGTSSLQPLPITELDLTHNGIATFTFFNSLTAAALPSITHLRVTGNPLYGSLISAEGKPLTTEDGYMLTLARLPHLQSLNYGKVTDKERLNAETYYLNQIGVEISLAPEGKEADIIASHPRWRELCEEYGEPVIKRQGRKEDLDPSSLAARLVTVTFHLAPGALPDVVERTWVQEVPKSFGIYALLGLLGKRLQVMPLKLRLVLESNERDPLGRHGEYAGPEWWDSSDEEVDGEEDGEQRWVKREVELVAGTRAVGTYVEGLEASVRVEERVV